MTIFEDALLVVLIPLAFIAIVYVGITLTVRPLPVTKHSSASFLWGVFAGLMGIVLSGWLFAAAFVLVLISICGAFLQPSERSIRYASRVVAGILFVGVSASLIQRLVLLRDMQADYPVMSVAERLDYERTQPETEPLVLAPDTRDVIDDIENQHDRLLFLRYRNSQLRALHRNSEATFLLTAGFGVGRMAAFVPSPEVLKPIEPVDTPLPQLPEPYESVKGEAGEITSLNTFADDGFSFAGTDGETRRQLRIANFDAVLQFTIPERLGYVVNRDYVVGFEPHAIAETQVAENFNNEHWSLTRLELVSLLKHETPRVYISEHLPNMEELIDVPTRDPDLFEAEALKRLNQGEQLVIQESPTNIRMLGGIRATELCLKCHHVRRGELLGAFSYKIIRHGDTFLPNPINKPAEPLM